VTLTSLNGAIELRKALRKIEPTLAKESQKEIANLLKVVTRRAKGYVPSEAPLSGWGNAVGIWENRVFRSSEVKRGIGYSTSPSKPNRRGFRSLATIFNKSAAGAIYETAGRLNPQGQPSQESTRGVFSSYIDTSNKVNKSANNNAGRQFIDALPPLVDSQQSNVAGRRTRKTKGRLLFRAWAVDQGKTNAAVIKAMEKSVNTAIAVTKGVNREYRGR
jgi:hypothetical protein